MSRACSAWLGLVVAFLATVQGVSAARADKASCAAFAADIVQWERSPARPLGWTDLDNYLRYLYAEQCVLKPTRARPAEYWYSADGKPLGIPADYTPPGWDPNQAYRPEDGAFTTTPQIAAECARVPEQGRSMCAMLKGLEAACLKPIDSEQRTQCEAILDGRVPDLPQAADALPPLADVLRSAASGPPRLDRAAMAADPGFQRMCSEANTNLNKCTVRRENMSSMGGPGNGGTGQAGAFYECQKLYAGVLSMCRLAGVVNKSAPKAIAAPPKPEPTPKPGEASGRSAPPPTAGSRCPAGATLTKDGYCLAANQNYCGNGMMCADGMKCGEGLQAGRCVTANGCLPSETEVPGGCLPAGMVYCGGGAACPAWAQCVAGGCQARAGVRFGPTCGNGLPVPVGYACGPGGLGYDPRTQKVCGTTLCGIENECGNNACLMPYHQVAAPKPK